MRLPVAAGSLKRYISQVLRVYITIRGCVDDTLKCCAIVDFYVAIKCRSVMSKQANATDLVGAQCVILILYLYLQKMPIFKLRRINSAPSSPTTEATLPTINVSNDESKKILSAMIIIFFTIIVCISVMGRLKTTLSR